MPPRTATSPNATILKKKQVHRPSSHPQVAVHSPAETTGPSVDPDGDRHAGSRHPAPEPGPYDRVLHGPASFRAAAIHGRPAGSSALRIRLLGLVQSPELFELRIVDDQQSPVVDVQQLRIAPPLWRLVQNPTDLKRVELFQPTCYIRCRAGESSLERSPIASGTLVEGDAAVAGRNRSSATGGFCWQMRWHNRQWRLVGWQASLQLPSSRQDALQFEASLPSAAESATEPQLRLHGSGGWIERSGKRRDSAGPAAVSRVTGAAIVDSPRFSADRCRYGRRSASQPMAICRSSGNRRGGRPDQLPRTCRSILLHGPKIVSNCSKCSCQSICNPRGNRLPCASLHLLAIWEMCSYQAMLIAGSLDNPTGRRSTCLNRPFPFLRSTASGPMGSQHAQAVAYPRRHPAGFRASRIGTCTATSSKVTPAGTEASPPTSCRPSATASGCVLMNRFDCPFGWHRRHGDGGSMSWWASPLS